ncbi:MAG: hypothetical protein LBU67_03425 [Oscillospiraceae bacterium]|nr:hypothetical protein [Oscillospiraceae bacterium]
MLAGIALAIAYIFYALGGGAPDPNDLRAWATAMLVFIGIGVAALVVIQIIFHILFAVGTAVRRRDCDDKQVERILSATMSEDEMDRLITLQSTHAGYICAGIGLPAALVMLALGASAVAALHTALGAFAAGSLVEGIVSIRLYEGGVRRG